MADQSNWSKYDVGAQFPKQAKGFASSVFDGRFLYFVPRSTPDASYASVARYDTQADFATPSSWTVFDLTKISAAAKGYYGGAFDGRYIYLVPVNNGVAFSGTVVRYDIQAPFDMTSSWTAFDITSVNPNAAGYVSATFDGRYVYFTPYSNQNGLHGDVARYDTQASFTASESWTTFNTAKLKAQAVGFRGSTFDGRYVYFAPNGATDHDTHGNVVRYDTRAADGFTAAASWSVFNVAGPYPNAVGFYGATFDGRYVYLVQYDTGDPAVGPGGVIARYDTQADFQKPSSWSAFDAHSIYANARGFSSAVFDGRNVYLVPNAFTAAFQYNTESPLNASTSYSAFDLTAIAGHQIQFRGAGFDGQYLYFVPQLAVVPPATAGAPPTYVVDGTVVRFKAKSPAWLPRFWSNAFD